MVFARHDTLQNPLTRASQVVGHCRSSRLKFAGSDAAFSTGAGRFAWNDVNRGQLFSRASV
jgi:hypothetical protein